MKPKNTISDAEAEVLQALWASDGPATTAEICKAVETRTGWDRSTVRTLIRRLVDKGAVEEMKLEVLSYRPSLTEEDYRRTQTDSFLERHYGGSARRLVASLVENNALTEDDIAALRDFLKSGGDGHA
jgi:BlaI family penicillinase repressor